MKIRVKTSFCGEHSLTFINSLVKSLRKRLKGINSTKIMVKKRVTQQKVVTPSHIFDIVKVQLLQPSIFQNLSYSPIYFSTKE